MEGFFKALDIIIKNIPLPISYSYVCFHPDRVIKNEQIVKEAIQKVMFISDKNGKTQPISKKTNQKKVAIVGSGPAGLSAAHYLAKKRYSITIFEALPAPGGMLRRCIPQYRLPKKFVDFDIMMIKNQGIEIKTNISIGRILKIKELFDDGFDAIFLATGAQKDKKFKIEGQELNGIFHALNFLEKANKKDVELLKKVIIIGGGNVAIDSARTALRFGSKEVTVLYRRSEEEIPASPWEIKEAEEEGVKIEYFITPKRFLGKNGNVTKVECIKTKLGELDKTGRRHPIPIEGSEFNINTDAVIIAVGQFPDTVFLPEDVEVSKQKTIETDPFTMETSSPRIFAGGDVVLGSGTLIEAIFTGRQAAYSIDCLLRNIPLDPLEVARNTIGNGNGGF
jgi:NADPH-dependent glutamate synthase beta subunit-like oxidoreductase